MVRGRLHLPHLAALVLAATAAMSEVRVPGPSGNGPILIYRGDMKELVHVLDPATLQPIPVSALGAKVRQRAWRPVKQAAACPKERTL